ncbi:MAG: DNA phosphorothioation system restriction enzyme, partial [Hydrogenophilales bacterium]|nr:DNA phosphorothioation system restriction enzyme [Hydrogenophilales bacterium]
MKLLKEISLKLSYRTGRDDLVRDFFIPCLEASVLYRRAAGYFSSSGLALAARGVASLASRGGKMKLVVSPHLQPEDVEALQAAAEHPADAVRAIVAKSLADIEDALVKDRLNALAWLAAAGLLEIKLALRLDPKGHYSRGIFHEKAGVFSDSAGNRAPSPRCLLGRPSMKRLVASSRTESIKAFCLGLWRDGSGGGSTTRRLWNDSTPGL